MTYIDEITLDFNAITNFPIIAAKQNDTNSRIYLIHFTKNGVASPLDPSITTVALRIRKPDNHVILNSGTINNDGTATITLTRQCLTAAGRAYADIYISEVDNDGNEELLSVTSFIINIMASPNIATKEIFSSDEFDYLLHFIQDAEDYIRDAQAWAEGKRGSNDVIEGENQYHNNSKYYSEIAQNLISSSASYLFFDIDYTDGQLYVFRPESDSFSDEMNFEVDDTTGQLVVNLNNGQ